MSDILETLNKQYNLYKYDNVYNDMKIGEAKVLLKDEVLHTESIYLKKIEEKQVKKEKKSLWQRIIGWFKKW